LTTEAFSYGDDDEDEDEEGNAMLEVLDWFEKCTAKYKRRDYIELNFATLPGLKAGTRFKVGTWFKVGMAAVTLTSTKAWC
jgi:hypothetical protein